MSKKNEAKKQEIKKHQTKAQEIGRTFAAETLKRRDEAAARRKRALTAHAKLASPKGAKGPLAKATSIGTLVAEGDSWFDYPFYDVLSNLDDLGYDVEAVARMGDTVEDMAYSDGQLDAFGRSLEKVLRAGTIPKAILLSGGGNDIAGDEFAVLLNHAKSSIRGINNSIVSGLVEERLRDAYVMILSAVTAVCKGIIGKTVPIIVHGYAYSVPDGRGYAGGWGPLPGPWLEPSFRRKGYDDLTRCTKIVEELIKRFNAMLGDLAGKGQFAHVHYLNLIDVLPNDNTYKKHWGNELHPTSDGFKKVAAKFHELILTF